MRNSVVTLRAPLTRAKEIWRLFNFIQMEFQVLVNTSQLTDGQSKLPKLATNFLLSSRNIFFFFIDQLLKPLFRRSQ